MGRERSDREAAGGTLAYRGASAGAVKSPDLRHRVSAVIRGRHGRRVFEDDRIHDFYGAPNLATEPVRTDFLVLGSGIAGLRAAMALARTARVLVVTKDQPTESNTGYAQGGVAVALADDDEPRPAPRGHRARGRGHRLRGGRARAGRGGAGAHPGAGPWGARFDREDGRFHFTREGAHSRNRVLHALGDATGWEMARALLDKARRTEAVRRALLLVLHRPGRRAADAWSAAASSTSGERRRSVLARATLLATGGAGQVFRETTNPPVATGDGAAMALRAGAALLDMEFVQFHPTALAVPGAPRFLVSEAVRGEGARLLNGSGERFTDELAPRDEVARAIARENGAGRGPVVLDLRHLDAERVRTRFPRIHRTCLHTASTSRATRCR